MSTIHYRIGVDYLGAFGDGASPTEPSAIECPAPDNARQKWGGDGWLPLATPEPTYAQALADLNAAYQADVDSLNRAFTVATLAEGASMVVKQNAVKAQYTIRKNQYATDYAALRAQYGV